VGYKFVRPAEGKTVREPDLDASVDEDDDEDITADLS
jgi:hypothetical protein